MHDDPPGQSPHVPVLGHELVEMAAPRPGDVVVDCTFGAGGHSRLLAAAMDGRGTLYAIDRDPTVVDAHDALRRDFPKLEGRLLRRTFPEGLRALAREGVSAHAVILDVGVSSMQLDQPQRGFAYSYDAPLDMRMDPSAGPTAADLLATLPEAEIVRILREYGEERFARRIAGAIVERRRSEPFERTSDLVEVVKRAMPAPARFAGGHPAKRTFQALRIAVNDELSMLDEGLDEVRGVLAPGGRVVAISFHSLEDRIVKRRFAEWAQSCTCPPELPECRCAGTPQVEQLSRRGVVASAEELESNPRAASARMRGVRLIAWRNAA